MSIPVFSLESSRAPTELCILGGHCRTDKSPFNTAGHRHPYTPFYSGIFAPYKNKPIHFAEIGVAGGSSVAMWSRYFTQAHFSFFDKDQSFLDNAERFQISRAKFYQMDVAIPESIRAGFAAPAELFDIILDDSSHDVWDQKKIVGEVLPFLKPGGIFLIEDVFRNLDNQIYMDIISPYLNELAFFGFYEMEHKDKWSPGWDNDKILMLVKN